MEAMVKSKGELLDSQVTAFGSGHVPFCSKDHAMEKFMKGQCPDRYSVETAFCDICHGLLRASSYFYHCKECAYDICGNCFTAAEETAAPTTQQHKTESIFESSHPYENNLDEYTSVEMSGASGYLISFDKDSSIDFAHDYIRFYKDDEHIDYWGQEMYSGGPSSSDKNFPGMDNRPPLVIPASRFIIHFHTNKSGSDWGYKFTVKKCSGDSFHTGEWHKQSDTPTHCALDVDDLKNCQCLCRHKGGIIIEDHWSCCGSIESNGKGCIKTNLTKIPHKGEWRVLSELKFRCAVDEKTQGASKCLCQHYGGIIKKDHWSCCGDTNEKGRGCDDDDDVEVKKPVDGAPHKGEYRDHRSGRLVQCCALDDQSMLNSQFRCEHPDAPLQFSHWSCCGAKDSDAEGCDIMATIYDPAQFIHTGEWRDQSSLKYRCATDDISKVGSKHICGHGGGIIKGNHWSCCGVQNEKALGCRSKYAHEMVQGQCHICALCAMCTGMCPESKARAEMKKLYDQLQKEGGGMGPAGLMAQSPDMYMKLMAIVKDRQDDKGQECGCGAGPAGCVNCSMCSSCAAKTRCPGKPVSSCMNNSSLVFESNHPYVNGQDVYSEVVIPDATGYLISFDTNSSISIAGDFVRFYTDESHTTVHGEDHYTGGGSGVDNRNYPGCDNRPPLKIAANKFILHFHTESEGLSSEWGYKVTVTRNDATVTHLGEWRIKLDPKLGSFKCALDEDSMAGSKYMCTHGGVISGSHWSCCGSRKEDCPGCPASKMGNQVAIPVPTKLKAQTVDESKIFESAHPYKTSMDEKIAVEIPDAVAYSISFDSQTSMNGRSDFIRFYMYKNDEPKLFWSEENYNAGPNKNFPGCDGRPPLIVPSGRLMIHFYTDGSNDTDWGYKLTVTSSHSKGPHSGDWRDQSRLRCFCAIDVDTMGGATQLCEHLEGVITASHWSCCGAKEFDAAECVSIAGVGNTKMISLLLEEGIDPSICNHEGNNALMIACDRGRFDVVKLILEKMPIDTINMTNKHGRTALTCCIGDAVQVWWEKNIALTWKFVISTNGKDVTFPGGPSTLLSTTHASPEGTKKISWRFVMRGNDSWCVGAVPLKEETNQKYLFENGKYGLSNSGLIGGKLTNANMHKKSVRMVLDAVALCLLISIDGENDRKFDMTPEDFPAGLGICGFNGSRCTMVNVADINIVRLLLNKNIDLDIPDQQKKTALVWAIGNNQKDIVIDLLRSDANLEVLIPSIEYQKVAVAYALGEAFEDTAKKLIGATWWSNLFNKMGDLLILKTAIDKNWQEFVSECIRAFQPFKGDSDTFDGAAKLVWCYIVALNNVYAPDVIFVLDKYLSRVKALADATDFENRRAVDIAKRDHKKAIQDRLYFFKRYELSEKAIHKSDTCVVYIGTDKDSPDSKVALKFIQKRVHFEREIEVRNQGNFDENFVLKYLRIHDGDADEEFAQEVSRKKLYKYCVVMPQAERSLFDIMTHEQILNDSNKLHEITREITAALQHVHSQGYVHGDIKPHNIIRIEGRYRLIDFDASAKINDVIGMKISSLYIPPEMVKRSGIEGFNVRTASEADDGCIASVSYDMWALGVTLFYLFTGKSLFHADTSDNIDAYSLKKLFAWNPSIIKADLDKITLPEARNLISRLLSYDKSKRPDATRVLCHPFITGAKGGRMVGEAAPFDVFLSYRVWSDEDHVAALEQLLLDKGLRVWRDTKKLKNGENWRQGFCEGMANSRVIVLLLSRHAVNNENDENCNFSLKTELSACDNVLLEHRFALELSGMGLAEKIYPVMIGDIITVGTDLKTNKYDRYGPKGKNPHAPVPVDVCVREVETQLVAYLFHLGLGAPLKANMTVKQVYNGITANQGVFIEGWGQEAFAKVADNIHNMVIELDTPVKVISDGMVEGGEVSSPGGGGNGGESERELQVVIAAQKKRIAKLEEQNRRFKGVLRV